MTDCTIIRPGGSYEGRQGLKYGAGISARPTKSSPRSRKTPTPLPSPHPVEPANGSKRKRDGPSAGGAR